MTKKYFPRFCAAVALLSTNAFADLILHWKLDEAAGAIAADSSGNAIDGTWLETIGSPAWTPGGGVNGGSVSFSGVGADAFVANDFTAISALPFTMSTWVKTTSGANDTMVYLGDGGTNNTYYTTKIQSGAARVVARNTAQIQSGGLPVNDGEWHQVTSVYTSTTERTIYIDGVLGASNTVEVFELIPNRVGIGALTRGSGPVDQFTGELDDVAMWDRAFTALDAAALNGLGVLGAGNASDLDALVDAFTAEGSAPVNMRDWDYTTGLTGFFGETGGSVAGVNAFIVLDDLGNGMQMSSVPGSPVVNSFEASELAIFLGETTTLLWDVDGAGTLEIDQGIGSVVNPAGSIDVSPTETTTYTLTATNGNGTSEPQVTITVIFEPVVTSFTAAPGLIYAGETATLTWDAANFTSIEIDQGVAAIANPAGFVDVTPTETTTYTFTATNDNGTTIATGTVKVLPVPPPRELLLHWPFDEESGLTASDSAGSNDGTFLETGGAITRGTGLMGGALTFPNANDSAVSVLTQLVDDYPFSMGGWVKTIASANDTFAVLGTNQNGQYHSLLVRDGKAQAITRAGGFFLQTGPAVNDDLWHHIVAVYEHPASMSLYVDGVFAGERTTEAGEFVLPDRFGIGALARTDTSIVDSFDGTVDDVSFWRGILSADEVAALSGGATGLGLNASDIASLLTGFEAQSGAQAAGLSWTYTAGLIGAVGATGGSLLGGDGFVVLDESGNGMVSSPFDLSIISIVKNETGRTITWNSSPGSIYRIEYSVDLNDWSIEIDDSFVATEQVSSFADLDSGRLATLRGFYRVVLVPAGN